jgi:restriction system protein
VSRKPRHGSGLPEAKRILARQAREAEQARKASEREQAARARAASQARAAAERDAKRLRIERRKLEAVARTRALEDDVERLERILLDGLQHESYLDPESLKEPLRLPTFDPGPHAEPLPEPDSRSFLPPRPSALAQLLPGWDRRYEKRLTAAQTRYDAALAEHRKRDTERQADLRSAQAKHERRVAAIKQRVAEQHATIDALKSGLAAGQPRAIRDYFQRVLAARPRLAGIPDQARAVFIPDSNELIVEFELPAYTRMPLNASYQYVQTTDTFRPTLRPEKKRKQLYQRVIAQLTLLTVRDIFEADRSSRVDAAVVNGMLSAIDPATGKPVRPCVVSVCVTRDSYQGLNLAQVDPVECLTKLAAQLSPSPEELSPVQPILAQAFFDAPYIEEMDVLASLDSRPNLLDLTPEEFEHLVANLFSKLPRPLEVKPTRRSGDGGFDCVVRDPDPIFGGIVVVQARRYDPAKLKVGVSQVREMYGLMIAQGASNGILVTTTGFTKGSFDFSKDKPLKLISGSHLLNLLREHASIDVTIRSPGRWQNPIKPPP